MATTATTTTTVAARRSARIRTRADSLSSSPSSSSSIPASPTSTKHVTFPDPASPSPRIISASPNPNQDDDDNRRKRRRRASLPASTSPSTSLPSPSNSSSPSTSSLPSSTKRPNPEEEARPATKRKRLSLPSSLHASSSSSSSTPSSSATPAPTSTPTSTSTPTKTPSVAHLDVDLHPSVLPHHPRKRLRSAGAGAGVLPSSASCSSFAVLPPSGRSPLPTAAKLNTDADAEKAETKTKAGTRTRTGTRTRVRKEREVEGRASKRSRTTTTSTRAALAIADDGAADEDRVQHIEEEEQGEEQEEEQENVRLPRNSRGTKTTTATKRMIKKGKETKEKEKEKLVKGRPTAPNSLSSRSKETQARKRLANAPAPIPRSNGNAIATTTRSSSRLRSKSRLPMSPPPPPTAASRSELASSFLSGPVEVIGANGVSDAEGDGYDEEDTMSELSELTTLGEASVMGDMDTAMDLDVDGDIARSAPASPWSSRTLSLTQGQSTTRRSGPPHLPAIKRLAAHSAYPVIVVSPPLEENEEEEKRERQPNMFFVPELDFLSFTDRGSTAAAVHREPIFPYSTTAATATTPPSTLATGSQQHLVPRRLLALLHSPSPYPQSLSPLRPIGSLSLDALIRRRQAQPVLDAFRCSVAQGVVGRWVRDAEMGRGGSVAVPSLTSGAPGIVDAGGVRIEIAATAGPSYGHVAVRHQQDRELEATVPVPVAIREEERGTGTEEAVMKECEAEHGAENESGSIDTEGEEEGEEEVIEEPLTLETTIAYPRDEQRHAYSPRAPSRLRIAHAPFDPSSVSARGLTPNASCDTVIVDVEGVGCAGASPDAETNTTTTATVNVDIATTTTTTTAADNAATLATNDAERREGDKGPMRRTSLRRRLERIVEGEGGVISTFGPDPDVDGLDASRPVGGNDVGPETEDCVGTHDAHVQETNQAEEVEVEVLPAPPMTVPSSPVCSPFANVVPTSPSQTSVSAISDGTTTTATYEREPTPTPDLHGDAQVQDPTTPIPGQIQIPNEQEQGQYQQQQQCQQYNPYAASVFPRQHPQPWHRRHSEHRMEPPVWKWASLSRVEQSCAMFGVEQVKAVIASEVERASAPSSPVLAASTSPAHVWMPGVVRLEEGEFQYRRMGEPRGKMGSDSALDDEWDGDEDSMIVGYDEEDEDDEDEEDEDEDEDGRSDDEDGEDFSDDGEEKEEVLAQNVDDYPKRDNVQSPAIDNVTSPTSETFDIDREMAKIQQAKDAQSPTTPPFPTSSSNRTHSHHRRVKIKGEGAFRLELPEGTEVGPEESAGKGAREFRFRTSPPPPTSPTSPTSSTGSGSASPSPTKSDFSGSGSPTPSPTSAGFSECGEELEHSQSQGQNQEYAYAYGRCGFSPPPPVQEDITGWARLPAPCLREPMHPVLGLGTPGQGKGREDWLKVARGEAVEQRPGGSVRRDAGNGGSAGGSAPGMVEESGRQPVDRQQLEQQGLQGNRQIDLSSSAYADIHMVDAFVAQVNSGNYADQAHSHHHHPQTGYSSPPLACEPPCSAPPSPTPSPSASGPVPMMGDAGTSQPSSPTQENMLFGLAGFNLGVGVGMTMGVNVGVGVGMGVGVGVGMGLASGMGGMDMGMGMNNMNVNMDADFGFAPHNMNMNMGMGMGMGVNVNHLSPLSPISPIPVSVPVPLDPSLIPPHPHVHVHAQQTGQVQGTVTTTGLFDAYDASHVSAHAQGTLGTVEFGNVFGTETPPVPGVGPEHIGMGISPPVSPTTPEQTPLAGHIEA